MEDFFENYVEMTPDIKKIIKEHATETAEDGMIRSENRAAVIWWKAGE